MIVSRLTELPFNDFAILVAESEREGWDFIRRLVQEWESGTNRFARPGEALFGVRMDGRVVGVCGLNIDPYLTDSSIGRIRRVYVREQCRSQGIGRLLVEAAIAAARGRFRLLRLRTVNECAGRLYERLGFRKEAGADACTHTLTVDDA